MTSFYAITAKHSDQGDLTFSGNFTVKRGILKWINEIDDKKSSSECLSSPAVN
jgi:hypothetical protein